MVRAVSRLLAARRVAPSEGECAAVAAVLAPHAAGRRVLLHAAGGRAVERWGALVPALRSAGAAEVLQLNLHKFSSRMADGGEAGAMAAVPPDPEWRGDPPVCAVALLDGGEGAASTFVHGWAFKAAERDGPFFWGAVPLCVGLAAAQAARAVAGPGDGAFGRTAVLLQSTMRVERLGSPEGSELQLLRLQPRAKLVGGLDERSFQCLDHATRILFNGPGRVPIAEAAGRLCSGGSGVVAAAKLDPAARLQSLSVKQWCRLARALDAWPHWEGPHA